jgi:hypothetical protein
VEPENTQEPMPETEAIQPKSFLSRLGGVYLSPKSAFQEIGSSPRVLVPIIVMIIAGALMGFYLIKTVDVQAAVLPQLEKLVQQGRMTKQQMEQALPQTEKFAVALVLVSSIVGGVAVSLIIAGFAKLFSIFAGAKSRFKALLSVTCYTMFAISIIQSILIVLVLHFKGSADVDINNLNSVVASNLGAVLESLLGEDVLPKFVMGLLASVDVFAIWLIALLAMGYSTVSQKLKTTTAAIWLTAAYLVIAVIGAFRRAAM